MKCRFRHPSASGCQFVGESQFVNFNGNLYCEWHAPIDVKRNWDKKQLGSFATKLAARVDTAAKQLGILDLVGLVCTTPVSIENRSFSTIDLRNAQIDTLSCKGITVSLSLECQSLQVKKEANFDKAKLASASFSRAEFQGDLSFHEVHIEAATDFDGATFQSHSNFSGAVFGGRANFKNSAFKAESSFLLANFHDAALFDRANFLDPVVFHEARFSKRASFDHATFASHADFKECVFKDHAVFRGAAFKSYLGFSSALFMRDAVFSSLEPNDRRLPYSTWEGAKFSASASFENREFTTQGDFLNTEFAKAPNFHGCEFHQAMVFPAESAFLEREGAAAAQAYRTLRLAMEKLSARIEVGQFFALEQEALRNTPGRLRRHEWLMSWLYGALSNYGRNAQRPIVILLSMLLLFSVIYAISVSPILSVSAKLDLEILRRSLVFSIQQAVQPFWVWREPGKTILSENSSPLFVAAIATIQSIASVILVSLALLAIRWRFKRE